MRIFISYRRSDSEWAALALYNSLLKHFNESQIFKDFHTIKAGEDYSKSISANLSSSDILLLVIAKDWLTCKDEAGNQRLFSPNDYVRMEVETALQMGKKIIPVLMDNVNVPDEAMLPPSIAAINKLQSVKVSNTNLDMDVFNLVNAMHEITGKQNQYNEFVKDFATGKIQQEDLVKPESNSAYAIICVIISILILLGNQDSPPVVVITLIMIGLGVYAIYLSQNVKKLWLGKKFNEARASAKKTRNISLITIVTGCLSCLIGVLIYSLSNFTPQDANTAVKLIQAMQMDSTTSQSHEQLKSAPEELIQKKQEQAPVKPVSDQVLENNYSIGVITEETLLYETPSLEGMTLLTIAAGVEFKAFEEKNGFILGEFYTQDGVAFKAWVVSDFVSAKQ